MTDTGASIRGPLMLGLAALAVLVLGLGLWSTHATLAGAIIAPGVIGVEGDRQPVQHPEGGVVTEILVREGDPVATGDVLLRLDSAALRAQATILDDRLSDLAAVTARLEAERDGLPAPRYPADLVALAARNPAIAALLDGQNQLFEARRATLTGMQRQLAERIRQAHAQSEGIAAQRGAVATQLALLESELASQRALHEKGLVPLSPLLGLEREKARLSGQLGELAATLARIADQIAEIDIQIAALTSQRREQAAAELRDIGPVVLELTETRRALGDRIARLDLRAPVAGIVLGLRVNTPGAVLGPAEPALHIVPQDRLLIVTARISPLHVDEVAPGQHADLVLPAFPAALAPRLSGRVTLISADTQTDPRTGAAHYLARLEIAAETLPAGGLALVPGMPVEVFLRTAERTPLAYLLEPFTRFFTRALREG